jgi:hypothetical protein
MKYLFCILILSQCLILHGQIDTSNGIKGSDSLIRLKLNPYSDIKFFLGTPSYRNYTSTLNSGYYGKHLYEYDYQESSDKVRYDLSLVRENLNKSFIIMREGKRKYDLGVFGQILGYTNAAAVVGLAIYHISKYGIK